MTGASLEEPYGSTSLQKRMLRFIFTSLAFTFLIPLPSLAKEVTVKPGETLSEIADTYMISISSTGQHIISAKVQIDFK